VSGAGPLKNWKIAAYAALAEFYKVEAERATFEERLEEAKRVAARAGVSWRFGGPSVENVSEAYACVCGAVIAIFYGDARPVHCRECVEKTRLAVEADAKEEALRAKVEKPGDVHPPGPVVPPAPAPSTEGAPF